MLNGPNGSTCLIKQIKNFRYFLVLLLVAAVSVSILPSAKADTTGAAVPITVAFGTIGTAGRRFALPRSPMA